MAPSRKSRNGNKRFSRVNEVYPNKPGGNANKSRQKKRKLSDMLGPQWSKKELERFYEAYRKYGKDWKKVATIIRSRSAEMVEALYSMNRAYLSLPEGTASVVGLVAMMTDHYCILGVSDSDQESSEAGGEFREPQKRTRGKFQNSTYKGSEGHLPDFSQSNSVGSRDGCLSLLKKRRSGIIPHAVRKRTPRINVPHADKDNSEKYHLKLNIDAPNDDVAHEIMALTEASKRIGSPQVSQMPNRKVKAATLPSLRNGRRRCAAPEMTSGKLCSTKFHDGGSELSLQSTEVVNGDYDRTKSYLMGRECAVTEDSQEKGKNYHVKKVEVEDGVNYCLDDVKEAYGGRGERKQNAVKRRIRTEVVNESPRSLSKGSGKRSRKSLFGGDEDSPFGALQALADLSLMMPEEIADTVSVVEDTASRASKLVYAKGDTCESNAGIQKRKQKFLTSQLQIHENELQADAHRSDNQKIEATDEAKTFVLKGKHSSHNSSSLQQKLVKPLDLTSSDAIYKGKVNDSVLLTTEVSPVNQLNIPTKSRSRRKMDKRKSLVTKDMKKFEKVLDDQPNLRIPLFCDTGVNLKEALSNCLSQYQVRRWCAFEWFYSAIDCPWFAKSEFVEYLNHVGLGHVSRLTRVEWGVIRSSLGRPRRFSKNFLKEEKEKLNQYRESVRTRYAELHAGTKEGLPTDLALPLSVRQRVVAIHPRTREIQDGTVLTVDDSRYHVQFDRPDLGVEYVMDIDCMPLNPMENMPASLTSHNFVVNNPFVTFNVLKINEHLKEGKTEEYIKVASSENIDNADNHYLFQSTHDIGEDLRHKEGDSLHSKVQAKFGPCETTTQSKANPQPSLLAQIRAKEADVQALTELTRALDKKEAVVFELRHMNDEVLENQKDGDSSLRNSESFKKQYAAALLQLNEVNEQVSSALLCLRKRNTYQGISPATLSNPLSTLNDPDGRSSCLRFSAYNTQECGSRVAEIVESSKIKARKVVGAAMQAMSSLEKMGNKLETIEEAMDFVNDQLSEEDFDMPAVRSSTYRDKVKANSEESPGASIPLATCRTPDPELNGLPNQSEPKALSELIADCVATAFMIQSCTERQFPPAEVAQVLDSAVTSLHPHCPQNLPVYEDLQKLMGIIRTKILALIPA